MKPARTVADWKSVLAALPPTEAEFAAHILRSIEGVADHVRGAVIMKLEWLPIANALNTPSPRTESERAAYAARFSA